MKLSFLGAGKMATAICRGLLNRNVFEKNDILASDVSSPARKMFLENTGVVCTDDNVDVVRRSDVVILAVKPQIAYDVLSPLHTLFHDKLLISIAAGLSINKLSDWIGSNRIIRVMPNTPVMVGIGASVYACSSQVAADDRHLVRRIFDSVGIVKEMAEDCLDAVTGLSGSGPAYVYELIQAMTEAAVSVGLSAQDALDLVLQTISGATEMVRSKIGSPDELRDAVTSPGGTTEAGLAVLEKAKFRNLIRCVIKEATRRSVELGSEFS